RFFRELVGRFRQMAPLVRFLNEPLSSRTAPLDFGSGQAR
ncbi:MAG: hypothetical protein H6Q09_783, partial [Acidobacteria bacterium]|nr:hypothetical protein [Acidobacteriota bacterium]